MFDKIEEIYIANNTEGKKYNKFILPIITVLVTLMFILIMTRNFIMSCISALLVILMLIILKLIIYLKTVKPKSLIEVVLMRERYKKILYNRTRNEMVEYLKENKNYNTNTVNVLINYYKDLKPIKKFNIIKISNYIFSFLSAFGVILTIYNMEILNTIYLVIMSILILIVMCYLENKFLDKICEGILDMRVNYKELYKMFTEISLDIINNKNKRQNPKKVK